VYIEWFTPLGWPEAHTGMQLISHLTCHSQRNAIIIPINLLACGCHLMVKCGAQIDRTWTLHNVLECAKHFYLNSYIDIATFAVLKCN